MVETRARFVKPSSFGDRVDILSEVTGWRRASFDVHHQLFRGDDLAVEGFETRVWTERRPDGGLKSRPIPAEVLELFTTPVP